MRTEEIKSGHFKNEVIQAKRNGNHVPSDSQEVTITTGNISGATGLQEIEELNIHLSNQVKHVTKELNEAVASHVKFLSIIAHDLRSPFNTILGSLELLKAKLDSLGMADIESFITIAHNSARRTLNLLDNLLAWSVMQNEEKCLDPVRIDLHELVSDEIESIEPLARQKQINLYHTIMPGLNVSADLQSVKMIFRNLLSNAVKFTNKGGEITVSAAETSHFVEIAVEDNGVGISSETMKNLFKTQNLRSTAGTCNERGTGLGLLLCKEYVELHGGKIRAESQGKGSKFIFTLPHYL